jgi:flagellar biosynthesis chaperone FliJ
LLSSPESSPKTSGPNSTHQYNEHLNDFAEMLADHVSSIKTFRQSVEAAHGVWRPSSQNGAGSKEMDPEERMLRIARLKERGWERPRFDAQRYQDLCERAMAEL